MIFVYGIIAFVVLFLTPEIAFAWGPGMHMQIGMAALSHATLVLPVIRRLISKYPDDFLYGSVSPDIIVGKKYAGYIHHCHNWQMGRLILSEAKTDRQRASAYGYLMHLASDIVAHNYYIPFKMIKSYNTRLLSHTYWEMRFDLGVSDRIWRQIDRICEHESREFDALLERVLKKTIFSFKTNKRIFSSILNLQRMRGLLGGLRLYAKKSRWVVKEESWQHYADLATEAAFEFLADPEGADCIKIDPTGVERLAYAKNIRRHMKTLLGRGVLKEKTAKKFVELVQERLVVGLYRPELMLPDVTDVLYV